MAFVYSPFCARTVPAQICTVGSSLSLPSARELAAETSFFARATRERDVASLDFERADATSRV